MKVLCVIANLSGGGAEKVMAWLASSLADRDHQVTVLTWDSADSVDQYSVGPAVRRAHRCAESGTTIPQAIQKLLLRSATVKQYAKVHDVVLSFMPESNVPAILGAKRAGKRVVVSERVDPIAFPLSRLRSLFRDLTYPRADRLVVQTSFIHKTWASQRFPRLECSVIPNAIRVPELAWRGDLTTKEFIAVGRLHYQKGLDLVIRAFAKICQELDGWTLSFIGSGPEEAELRALVSTYGLTNRVVFRGYHTQPDVFTSQASIYVLPSRFEGFPNALAEAMALGMPCIAADCGSGPSELITPGQTGVLVPSEDVEQLANAMLNLARNPQGAITLGAAARRSVARYNPNEVLKLWESVLAGEEAQGGRQECAELQAISQ